MMSDMRKDDRRNDIMLVIYLIVTLGTFIYFFVLGETPSAQSPGSPASDE
jgi:hypothetical protein